MAVYRGTGLWDDGHAFKIKAFLCFNEGVSLEEEIENGCNEEEFGEGLASYLISLQDFTPF